MAMAFIPSGQRKPFDFAPEPYRTPGYGDGVLEQKSGVDLGQVVSDGLPGVRPIKPGMMFAGFNNPPPAMDPSRGIDRAPITTQPLDEALAPSNVPVPSLTPLPGVKPKKPGFFEDNGLGEKILDGLGEFALRFSAGQGNPYAMSVINQRIHQQNQLAAQKREDELRLQDREWARQDQAWKLSQPQYFMSGRDRVSFNPVTGETQTVYDAPEDFQEYANLLGLEPGSDEYNDAMEDYVLRSNGPTAQAGRAELESIRQNNRVSLEGVRQNNRAALRQMPTYSNLHPRPAAGGSGGGGDRPPRNTSNVFAPILAKVARGLPLTAGEQQVLSMYNRGRGGKGAVGSSAGTGGGKTATDPRTGKKVQWNGSQWVPIN